jgi:predicted metal-dependent phosphotriesterase family hydrolase
MLYFQEITESRWKFFSLFLFILTTWLGEWTNGIDKTGIRPGFIKLAVDGGGLSKIDRKLIRAAAQTHLSSGLAIAVHTGENVEQRRSNSQF